MKTRSVRHRRAQDFTVVGPGEGSATEIPSGVHGQSIGEELGQYGLQLTIQCICRMQTYFNIYVHRVYCVKYDSVERTFT